MSTNYLALRSSAIPALNAVSVNYSTLTGSTITVLSTFTAPTVLYSTLKGSTMNGLTLTLSTLNVSSINNSAPGVSAYSTLNVSTLNAVSSITVSTLTVSSINGGAPGIGNASAYSTLNVSSLNAVSTLTTSSINVTTGTMEIGTANPSAAGYVWRVGSAGTGSGGGAGNFYIYGASSGNSGVKMVINPSGYVGIGTLSPSYTLHVIGAIYASGDITALSDQRYKQNIVRLDRSLDRLLQVNGYSYTREDYRPGETQLGLLAQEVATVFPEAVHYDETHDQYSLNYQSLIAPMIEAIKDLQHQLYTQNQTIQMLLDRLGPS